MSLLASSWRSVGRTSASSGATAKTAPPVYRVADLARYFPVSRGVFRAPKKWIKAVDGVSFSIPQGTTFGLVGESGCGKTTLARILVGIEKPSSGAVYVNGKNLFEAGDDFFRAYRSTVQMVFQDPFASLDPRMRVRDIIREPLDTHSRLSRRQKHVRVEEVLELVGLRKAVGRLRPHQFSGGERQRIALARAMALNPRIIILDEPVSSLDASVRAQILNLLIDMQEMSGYTYLFISHDLAAVRYVSHTVGVMYLGKLVEIADSKTFHAKPLHPYAQALLASKMTATQHPGEEHALISGEVPSAIAMPPGCRFHPRCPFAMPVCSAVEPELRELAEGQSAACHLYGLGERGEGEPQTLEPR